MTVRALGLALLLALAACGGGRTTVVVNRLVTPEQSRADLQKALEAGAITPAEYQDQLARLR